MFNEEKKREEFLEVISGYVHYWDKEVEGRTQKERLEGLAFSILSHIDGSSGDEHFLIPRTNSFSPIPDNNIAGSLHSEFFHIHRKCEKER